MQLTRAADYAVRVMITLAGMPPGSRSSRESLAEAAEVPAQFLGKVLQSLTRSQLIVSHRGSRGGFSLGRPAAGISMLDVVESIEGPIQLNVCLGPDDACGRRWFSSAHEVWLTAQAVLSGVLQSAKLDRLAADALQRKRFAEAAPPPIRAEEIAWS